MSETDPAQMPDDEVPDVALMDGLTDESPALALDTQRRHVELIHNPSTAERVIGLHEEGVGR